MATDAFNEVGKKIGEIDLLGLFPADEGQIDLVYGRIGTGKTTTVVCDIWKDLKKGRVVYVNFQINYDGYDQRKSLGYVLLGLLRLKRRFYSFPKENLRFIEINEEFIDNFSKLTDCKVYLDEGHVIFDSYLMAKISMKKRNSLLHTRHFNRSVIIATQRPTAMHVTGRANVNRFLKCQRPLRLLQRLIGVVIIKRTEYQDMTGETVDETTPTGFMPSYYWPSKKILASFNTKYLRGGIPSSQEVYFDAYSISFKDAFRLMRQFFRARFTRLKPRETPKISDIPVKPRLSEFPLKRSDVEYDESVAVTTLFDEEG